MLDILLASAKSSRKLSFEMCLYLMRSRYRLIWPSRKSSSTPKMSLGGMGTDAMPYAAAANSLNILPLRNAMLVCFRFKYRMLKFSMDYYCSVTKCSSEIANWKARYLLVLVFVLGLKQVI